MKTWTVNTPLNEKEGASTRPMRQWLASLCLLAIILVALASADVRAETVNCTAITTLPYTISTPGSYCLTGHLSTSITTGNAITINASDVVFDLNSFALRFVARSDDGAGETEANGIYALNQDDITIRNGMIKGFKHGIFLDLVLSVNGFSASSRGHVIEDIRAHRNILVGIAVKGTGGVLRNNHVLGTGINSGQAYVHGITVNGPSNRLINNDVINTGEGQGPPGGVAIQLEGDNCVVEGNRVSGKQIYVDGMVVGGLNLAVVNNRLTGTFSVGMALSTGCVFRDNLVRSASYPYLGGTDTGGNYP